MSYTQLDEDLLVQMYKDEIPVPTIRKHFNVTKGTIYRHLRAKGIEPDRCHSIPWTDEEDAQLITAHGERLTGTELCKRIPTRTPAAVKITCRNCDY